MLSNKTSEHHLEFLDQTALELLLATGRNQLIQCAWIYEHPVDEEGLERFHHNFYASIAGRVIERSLLPFGRPRWVRPGGPIPPIQRGAGTRPRSEVQDWLNELGDLPVDPVRGPASYLAVQSFDDGSTGVCIVASHVLGDGVGGMMAIFEAITGNIRNLGYEMRGDRTRGKSVVADLRQVIRDLPLTARTAVRAAKMVRAKRDDFARARAANATGTGGGHVVVPSVGIFVDTGSWDATAPAIFRLLTHNKQGVAWVASLGARGMLWSGTELRVFGSPEEALAEIRARMA